MHSQWHAFLESQGATLNEQGVVTSWGQPDLERIMVKHGPVRASLAHKGLIRIQGDEAFNFLQGQLTNDLSNVTDTQAQLSGYCDPKGQLLGLFTVFKIDQAWYLHCDPDVTDTVVQRLNLYKLRAQVEIENVSDQLVQIGYAGEFADLNIQRLLDTKIKETYEVQPLEGLDDSYGIKVPGPYHRYLFVAPPQQAETIWQGLTGNGEATNDADWQLLDVVSGLPRLTQATAGQFIAQFLNLDKLDAINFRKGCFPGQEVIARLHFRGKVTKRMVRLHLKDNQAELAPGDTFKLLDQKEKPYKFTLINAAEDIEDGKVCLAITTLKPLETAQAPLTTEAGQAATIEPLPYDILSED
ncbi:folate-binding protein YgfZ [Thiomicrospira sp. WB1]|uniref:CAF17-like 4Fe-4S cluster assembly/insertion protein YgfZ n=1 Tax=Thiomicrospira sp. WB1 TaxID=1685380 RepID=UPI00074A09C8|nr:folate-binding protein YgfZ [Thiomicrospira sp. WB1]KUJ71523.1 glycine cleavage system protein T [Thiomicrospira sp. WB1]